ncbi:MAG: DNA translocase FtsK 4TM domain-containing protein, partial [Paracoccaceae bacterium]
MATYQARQRDPLFDRATQASLERRGKELVGFALLFLAVLFGLLLWSYAPQDPSWLSATDDRVVNILGKFGASVASPVIVIVGLAGWGITTVMACWGLRLVAHVGEERAIPRLIFAPIGIALASVYMSTHLPGPTWTHSFGLGGLFGDTVLGAILGVLPVSTALGLKIMSFVMAAATLLMAILVLGFTRPELGRIGRFLIFGVIMVYAGFRRLLGMGATGSLFAARKIQAHRADKKDQKRLAEEGMQAEQLIPGPATQPAMVLQQDGANMTTQTVLRADPKVSVPIAAPATQQDPKPGLLTRLLKRSPEAPAPKLHMAENFGDPEIKAKIAQVIKNRVMQKPLLHTSVPRTEPLVNARNPRGPAPMVLHPNSSGGQAEQTVQEVDVFDVGADPAMYQASEIPLHDAKKVVQHAPRKIVQPSRQ